MFFLNMKKKGSSQPFLGHSGGGQETTLFKGGPSFCISMYLHIEYLN